MNQGSMHRQMKTSFEPKTLRTMWQIHKSWMIQTHTPKKKRRALNGYRKICVYINEYGANESGN